MPPVNAGLNETSQTPTSAWVSILKKERFRQLGSGLIQGFIGIPPYRSNNQTKHDRAQSVSDKSSR
jgi:hypothetical protein